MDIDEKLLFSTDDAMVWATEFFKVCPEVNIGLMIAWFANLSATTERLTREKYDPVYNAKLAIHGISSRYIGDQ